MRRVPTAQRWCAPATVNARDIERVAGSRSVVVRVLRCPPVGPRWSAPSGNRVLIGDSPCNRACGSILAAKVVPFQTANDNDELRMADVVKSQTDKVMGLTCRCVGTENHSENEGSTCLLFEFDRHQSAARSLSKYCFGSHSFLPLAGLFDSSTWPRSTFPAPARTGGAGVMFCCRRISRSSEGCALSRSVAIQRRPSPSRAREIFESRAHF